MKKNFVNINKIIESINKVISIIAGFSIVSLICGFIIVNSFLNEFGFYDFSFFQTRYIASGTLFLVIIITIILISYYLIFNRFKSKFNLAHIVVVMFISLICLLIIYPKMIYPRIPFAYGGGRSICVAILFNEQSGELIPVRKKLSGEVQYLMSTLLYQTNDYLLLRTDRGVFLVYRDKIKSIFYPNQWCDFKDSGMNMIFLNQEE